MDEIFIIIFIILTLILKLIIVENISKEDKSKSNCVSADWTSPD
jgi:hypothetical protein